MKILLTFKSLVRLISIGTLLSAIFLFLAPNSFDTVFLLFVECISLMTMLAILSFVSRSVLDIVMQVLVSAFLIPILIFFLGCGLLLCLLIFSGGGPEAAETLPYPLLQHCWLLMDDPVLAIERIVNYFGSDLYWILGGFLVFHFVFDYVARKLNSTNNNPTDNDLWFKIQKQTMLQVLALFLGVLLLCIPMSILIGVEDDQTNLTYGLVITLRLLVECWKIYLERDKIEAK